MRSPRIDARARRRVCECVCWGEGELEWIISLFIICHVSTKEELFSATDLLEMV